MTGLRTDLEARADIADAIYRYCRSLDRMDRDLMATVFHPAATVQYPTFEGGWQGFADFMWPRHRAFDQHSHQVSNVVVTVSADGASALSEAYVTATLWRACTDSTADSPRGTSTQTLARYLDRWSLADGRWAIDHRQCVVDAVTEVTGPGLLGAGRRDGDDPSCAEAFTVQFA
jgi:hypothetical protein